MILYTSTQIERFATDPEAKRAELTADVISVLRHGYDLQILGNLSGAFSVPGTLYVRTGYDLEKTLGGDASHNYAMWEVSDNGGEFNVAKVNSPEPCRSVPYLGARIGLVDAGTVAYRIAMVIKGEPIDYDFTCPDVLETCREMDAAKGGA